MTATFQCPLCSKTFKTKQHLRQHENRRFTCTPQPTDTVFSCKCGKSYRHKSNLCTHKKTCPAVLQPATVKALMNGVQLNTIDTLDFSKVNNDLIKQAYDAMDAPHERLRVQHHKICYKWSDYKKIYMYILDTVFKTPENMIFYIQNKDLDEVYQYDKSAIVKTTTKEMIDSVRDAINEYIDDIIRQNDYCNDHPLTFMHEFKISSSSADASVKSFQSGSHDIALHIKQVFNVCKPDIKALWTTAGLL